MKNNIILSLFFAASMSIAIMPILTINEETYSEINNFKNTQQSKIPITEKNDAKIPEAKTENQGWSTKKKIAVVVGVIGIVILCAGFIMIPPMMKILKQFEEGETRYTLETEIDRLNSKMQMETLAINKGSDKDPEINFVAPNPNQHIPAENNLIDGLNHWSYMGKLFRKIGS